MKYYDCKEVDELDETWIDCTEGLPPPGKEVIVETVKGEVTARARYLRYEGCRDNESWWDNRYGVGHFPCLFEYIVRWRRFPNAKTATKIMEQQQTRPDSTTEDSAQFATIRALVAGLAAQCCATEQLIIRSLVGKLWTEEEAQLIWRTDELFPKKRDRLEKVMLEALDAPATEGMCKIIWEHKKDGEVSYGWSFEPTGFHEFEEVYRNGTCKVVAMLA